MRLQITAYVEVPDGIPMDQVVEWVEFELGANCSMSKNNPLFDDELECSDVSVRKA